jgi:hypothetical protein
VCLTIQENRNSEHVDMLMRKLGDIYSNVMQDIIPISRIYCSIVLKTQPRFADVV